METIENDTDRLKPIQKIVQACIQCGTCSGSCPNEFAMDYTPRNLWQMVLSNETDKIFQSRTFILCSACYYCTLRCPRGLELTDAMAGLKQIAVRENLPRHRQSTLFYKNFVDSVRRHGRVREMEFMTLYFLALKNPLLPLGFAGLGAKLFMKKKIDLQLPSRGTGKLAPLFDKVAELEEET
ncbi:MAG: 4Fe-4S dicluster domain-containing protein [Desulfobacteraceae bacterium]